MRVILAVNRTSVTGLAALCLAAVALAGCVAALPPLVVDGNTTSALEGSASEPALAPDEGTRKPGDAPAEPRRVEASGLRGTGSVTTPGAALVDLHPMRPGEAEYRGEATVIIRYDEYDAAGAMVSGESRTYQRPVTVVTRAPDACGSAVEGSAFHMSAFTDLDPANPLDGDFALVTGDSLVSPSGGCVLLDYWKLTMTGSRATGVLADIHAAEGGQRNVLYATTAVTVIELVWPFGIERGATLGGTFTGESVRFRVEGTSEDGTRPFTIGVVVDRVE